MFANDYVRRWMLGAQHFLQSQLLAHRKQPVRIKKNSNFSALAITSEKSETCPSSEDQSWRDIMN